MSSTLYKAMSTEIVLKYLVLLFVALSFVLCARAQRAGRDPKHEPDDVLIKKQILCDDVERQVKDIEFAAVRVLARYHLATWLWKAGKDATGRAEKLAVDSIDDFYLNKAEIPQGYLDVSIGELFVFLDKYAKDEADKLREKYKIGFVDKGGNFFAFLSQKDGDRLAVDAAIKSLANQSETNPELGFLIWQLQRQNSPQLLRLLSAIVVAEETGQTRFSADALFSISGYFVESDFMVDSNVPDALRRRFLTVILNKSRSAAQAPDSDAEGFYRLLSALIPVISAKTPELSAEATVIHAVLRARSSRESREVQERNDRIRQSTDKLSALIAEAEKADDSSQKYVLYREAARLALKQKKFIYSVDLTGKLATINMASNSLSEDVRQQERDYFIGQVVVAALEAKDDVSAKYAADKIVDPLMKANSLKKTATYYFDNIDPVSARYAIDEAVRLTTKADASGQRIITGINLLTAAQKIDRDRVSEIGGLTAKWINSIPALDVEDKPETEKYKKYVIQALTINWALQPALTKLVSEDRGRAADLASRIDKKEIRIVADLVLSIDSITKTKRLESDGTRRSPSRSSTLR